MVRKHWATTGRRRHSTMTEFAWTALLALISTTCAEFIDLKLQSFDLRFRNRLFPFRGLAAVPAPPAPFAQPRVEHAFWRTPRVVKEERSSCTLCGVRGAAQSGKNQRAPRIDSNAQHRGFAALALDGNALPEPGLNHVRHFVPSHWLCSRSSNRNLIHAGESTRI